MATEEIHIQNISGGLEQFLSFLEDLPSELNNPEISYSPKFRFDPKFADASIVEISLVASQVIGPIIHYYLRKKAKSSQPNHQLTIEFSTPNGELVKLTSKDQTMEQIDERLKLLFPSE